MTRWKVKRTTKDPLTFLLHGERGAFAVLTVLSIEAKYAQDYAAQIIRDHHRAEAFEAMRGAIKELLLLVDDMMPNIARGVVQNYQRLNEAPRNAKAALALCDKEPAP